MILRRLSVWLLMVLLALSFSVIGAHGEGLKVVATYSVLGDLVQNIGGKNIQLTVLVGGDGDPHVYEPTPQDVMTTCTKPLAQRLCASLSVRASTCWNSADIIITITKPRQGMAASWKVRR